MGGTDPCPVCPIFPSSLLTPSRIFVSEFWLSFERKGLYMPGNVLAYVVSFQVLMRKIPDCDDQRLSSIERMGRTQVATSHKYFIHRCLYELYHFTSRCYFCITSVGNTSSTYSYYILIINPKQNGFIAKIANYIFTVLYFIRQKLDTTDEWLLPKMATACHC